MIGAPRPPINLAEWPARRAWHCRSELDQWMPGDRSEICADATQLRACASLTAGFGPSCAAPGNAPSTHSVLKFSVFWTIGYSKYNANAR
ncbi:hypothetical protein WK25_07805 [Burkholderia latens]|nr:hypothetical protein WK25_07805 [Burkholderia latens]